MSETSPAKYGVILGIWDTHFQCHASKTGKKGKSAHKDQRLDQWYGVVEESQGCYIIKREGNCGIRNPILNFTHFWKVEGFGRVRRRGFGRTCYQGGGHCQGMTYPKGDQIKWFWPPFLNVVNIFFCIHPLAMLLGNHFTIGFGYFVSIFISTQPLLQHIKNCQNVIFLSWSP